MKCIVVTGAAGGIGRALVHRLDDAGYAVIATDSQRRPEGMQCEQFVRADLRRFARETRYADEVLDEVKAVLKGRALAGVINNAAIQIVKPFEGLEPSDWMKTLEVNLLAPIQWVRGLLPEIEAAKGMVLNISSIHARLTKPGFVAYATSKAALSGVTKALAVELGGRVRVNAIEPAAIDTDMLRAGFESNPAGYEQLRRYHPCGTIGSVEELADLAHKMLEMPGAFFNGMIAQYDGGIGSRLHDPEAD